MKSIERTQSMISTGKTCICIIYQDNEPFAHECEALKKHVKENKLYEQYDFWTDGCNYADEDYIHVAKKTPDNDHERGGFCWRSAVWKFEEPGATDVDPPVPNPCVDTSNDIQNCVCCQDAVADTVVLPCLHKVACKICSDKLKEDTYNSWHCIVCRSAITGILENAK